MGTTRVVQTYATSEFTIAGNNANPNILQRELAGIALSLQPFAVNKAGTDINIRWNDLPLASDIVLIDAAVAAHVGGDIVAASVSLESEDVSSNSTDVWDNKLTLTTPLLIAGTYEVVWYAEIAADAVVTNSSAAVQIVINGVQEFSDRQTQTPWFPVSGTNFVDVQNGDTITIMIDFRKAGTAANMAHIQKARASIKLLNS